MEEWGSVKVGGSEGCREKRQGEKWSREMLS